MKKVIFILLSVILFCSCSDIPKEAIEHLKSIEKREGNGCRIYDYNTIFKSDSCFVVSFKLDMPVKNVYNKECLYVYSKMNLHKPFSEQKINMIASWSIIEIFRDGINTKKYAWEEIWKELAHSSKREKESAIQVFNVLHGEGVDSKSEDVLRAWRNLVYACQYLKYY